MPVTFKHKCKMNAHPNATFARPRTLTSTLCAAPRFSTAAWSHWSSSRSTCGSPSTTPTPRSRACSALPRGECWGTPGVRVRPGPGSTWMAYSSKLLPPYSPSADTTTLFDRGESKDKSKVLRKVGRWACFSISRASDACAWTTSGLNVSVTYEAHLPLHARA